MIDLKKAREICEAATPGPWICRDPVTLVSLGGIKVSEAVRPDLFIAIQDAEFIAFARSALPEAIDEIVLLFRENEELRKRLELAEKVCEAMDVAGYLKHEGPHVAAWEEWRKGEGK